MSRYGLAGLLSLALIATVSSEAMADPILECPGESQVEVRACLAETHARADAALASAVGFARDSAASMDELMGGTAGVEAFQAGQTAWEAYRDAHCDYIGSTYGGGSGTGPAITACRITHARERVAELMAAI